MPRPAKLPEINEVRAHGQKSYFRFADGSTTVTTNLGYACLTCIKTDCLHCKAAEAHERNETKEPT